MGWGFWRILPTVATSPFANVHMNTPLARFTFSRPSLLVVACLSASLAAAATPATSRADSTPTTSPGKPSSADSTPATRPADPSSADSTPATRPADPSSADSTPATRPVATSSVDSPSGVTPEGPNRSTPNEAPAERSASAKQAKAGTAKRSQAQGPSGEREQVGKKQRGGPKNLSHHRLGSLAVVAGWGYGLVIPYDDIFCGEYSSDESDADGRKSLCTHAAPWHMEFIAGYGVLRRMDIVLGVRVNLQKRDHIHLDKLGFGLAPGVRLWITEPEKAFKVGAAIDILWMRESFKGYRDRTPGAGESDVKDNIENKMNDNDVGLRLGPILQYDFHHNVGVFLNPWARMTFLRWAEISFEIQLGIQARFP